MLRALSLTCLLLLGGCFSGEARFGGTFIGAIIADDGIIVASDSRSTFLDANEKAVGYVDGMTKIFVQQGAAFAVSGLTSVDEELFPAFVHRNEFLLTRPVDELLHGVAVWLPFRNSTKVWLISAGYLNGKPMICARNPNSGQACRPNGFVVNQPTPTLDTWYAELRVQPRADAAAQALTHAIQESAASDRTVGGPISVLLIKPNGSAEWVDNRPRGDRWVKVCDLVNEHRSGHPLITPLNTKTELDQYLASICP